MKVKITLKMAEKIVELSKLAPFGLKRPTVQDFAALYEPVKKRKVAGSLWTHEARMFAEKTIYLNKSTTKYAIIGNDSLTFEATMKICDRTTGSHITIPTVEKITYFMQRVQQLLKPSAPSSKVEGDSGIMIIQLPGDQWKFIQQDDNCAVQREIWSRQYPRMLEAIKYDMDDEMMHMNREEILHKNIDLVNDSQEVNDEKKIKYHICFGILGNRSYFQTLKEYEAFYD